MAYPQVLKPENMVVLALQMEKSGHLSKDLNQSEKSGVAYKLMTDQLIPMKKPDCGDKNPS